MKNTCPSIGTALIALWASTTVCEGLIAYTWVNQGMYTVSGTIHYELDFNGDDLMDLLFTSTGMWFSVFPSNDNAVIGSGGEVYALLDGFLIGSDVGPDLWIEGPSGVSLNTSAVVPPGDVISGGQFLETTAYMGVQFNIDESTYYGWVRISNPFDGISGGVIMDFAYETEPGVGIIAGAGVIPEPATTSLLTTGMLALMIGTRKRKSRTRRCTVRRTKCAVR
jgi:hypothetical protein